MPMVVATYLSGPPPVFPPDYCVTGHAVAYGESDNPASTCLHRGADGKYEDRIRPALHTPVIIIIFPYLGGGTTWSRSRHVREALGYIPVKYVM